MSTNKFHKGIDTKKKNNLIGIGLIKARKAIL